MNTDDGTNDFELMDDDIIDVVPVSQDTDNTGANNMGADKTVSGRVEINAKPKPAKLKPEDLFVDMVAEEVVDQNTLNAAKNATIGDIKGDSKNDKTSPDVQDKPLNASHSVTTRGSVPAQYNAEQAQNSDKSGVLNTVNGANVAANTGASTDYTVRKKGRIGDKLVEMGLISEDQLNVALQEKKVSTKMLGEILVDLGFITEEVLSSFLAEDLGVTVFDPRHAIVDGDALALLDKDTATKHAMLPISISDNDVHVAMADPYDILAMDALKKQIPKGMRVKPIVATVSMLNEAIDAAYGYSNSIKEILRELEASGEDEDVATLDEETAYTHPIVRLVNALVFDAVKLGVSDLHFEPEENFIRLRYRKDGVLYTAQTLHKKHWNGISQRIKIMSSMNIADKLSPQDGRFGMSIGGREADFRVSSLPTVHGENIVLRVLDQSASIMPMGKLGFSQVNIDNIARCQARPEGIIIVTGPTGSGKTTSLYSMLNEINTVDVNIQTLEDPVEYSLPMIRQTSVREGVLSFGDGIKALLRQDPDIIFIGEIRDQTTAEMALKAAMTGHQVYTTLHTNDSFGAIPRLLDLGLKPGMVAGAIIGVFAQRLIRVLCTSCKTEHTATPQECERLGVDSTEPPTIYKAKIGGCNACSGQGYKGRSAIVEILVFDEDLDEILARNESKAELKNAAKRKGFKSMKDDGILKVLDGVTDLDALSRVVAI